MVTACGGEKSPAELSNQGHVLAETLAHLNLSNPSADVETAIARGDTRFIGINGVTCYLPGLEKKQVSAAEMDLQCLAGTSDAIVAGDELLQEQARQYATAYNLDLERHLRLGQMPTE